MKRIALLVALAACNHTKTSPNGVGEDDAIFFVKSNVPDAGVYVDGRFIGPAGGLKGGFAVVPGKHRLELRHDDYFARYVELDAKRAERRKLEIELAPVLP
ncbi:MAG TPA: hypothetical protein VL326_03165 [Kofleriaceae bacterium]|jgi:hypothetical protein|nr:hypothetical protein [Kofleriaceae bacterium]